MSGSCILREAIKSCIILYNPFLEIVGAMQSDEAGNTENSNIQLTISNYFSLDSSAENAWTEKELEGLHEIAEDIKQWRPSEEGNIFLVNSYKEGKRKSGAAFIANSLLSMGATPVLVRDRKDLGRIWSSREDHGRKYFPVVFVTQGRGAIQTEKELQRVLASLGKKTTGVPVVVSLSERYDGIFQETEERHRIRYPQNGPSRAFVMLGISILVSPLFGMPYMQIPLGNELAVNDAGILELALFVYAASLLASGRASLKAGHFYAVFLAAIFYTASIAALNTSVIPLPFGITHSRDLALSLTTWNQNIFNALWLSFPAFLKIVAFSVVPLAFSSQIRRTIAAVLGTSLLTVYLSFLFFSSLPLIDLASPAAVQFGFSFPPLEIFYTNPGNHFMEALAGLPVAILYFYSYIRTSYILTEKLFVPESLKSEHSG